MTTITIADVISGAYHLRAKEPLVFDALYDEDADLYFLRDNPLGITLSEPSMQKLEEAIYVELDVLWRVYALEDDEKLTPVAQRLKRDLLETFEVVARHVVDGIRRGDWPSEVRSQDGRSWGEGTSGASSERKIDAAYSRLRSIINDFYADILAFYDSTRK